MSSSIRDLPVRQILRKPHSNAAFHETIELLSNEDYVVGSIVGGKSCHIEYDCFHSKTKKWLLFLECNAPDDSRATVEFQLLAERFFQLRHPNIQHALEFAQDTQGQMFLTTEPVEH